MRILCALWGIIRRRDFFLGPTVKEFEVSLSRFTRSTYVVGISSGTDALILSLKALGIGPGDEVIVPAISFFSTASAVSWVGATPVFVDIDPKSKTIDVSLAEKVITKKTKAIVPVHLDGWMANMDALMKLGEKYSVPVVVDGAHALGSYYKNRAVGEWGDIVCLSFSFIKPFGSYGNAGAILTNNRTIYEKLLPFRIYGASSKHELYSKNSVAAGSHRLDSFQAAVLNCKLPLWNSWIQKQQRYCTLYRELLRGIPGIELPTLHRDHVQNGFRFTVLTRRKKESLVFLAAAGIHIPDYYAAPLPYIPAFKPLGYTPGDFPVAEKFACEAVTLPTRFDMTEKEIRRIAQWVSDSSVEK